MIKRTLILRLSISIAVPSVAIASASSWTTANILLRSRRPSTLPYDPSSAIAFHVSKVRRGRAHQKSHLISSTAIHATDNDQPSFLSTNKAKVQFTSSNQTPANLSPIDSLFLTLTSDRTSLTLGSIGIFLLLLNRLLTFPDGEDAVMYEASRSRIDLLAVFAAGSVLLNGITKLDVTSVQAERVALDGIRSDQVIWNDEKKNFVETEDFVSTTNWALSSLIKCSPARTAVLLATSGGANNQWAPIAMVGVLPTDIELRFSIPSSVTSTPILDRMRRYSESYGKGGSVAGSSSLGRNKGPKESYLPTLQALPGRVEFTYLPSNTQEVLVLPVPTESAVIGGDSTEDGRYWAIVLGGDTAKSFTPKDVAWCREISTWIGDSLV
ncbi:hypothetical protein HJC23_001942 [Cyclotella cryptica]|uniref:Uncharacterized protein n=1 Tax=Cyclotella cryptica TaxID=29204 RepID=A0ABD3PED0_9STRA